MSPHKLQVFFGVYHSRDWTTANSLVGPGLSARTARKHLLDLCTDGFLHRVKAFKGYRYRVNPNADIEALKRWAEVYGQSA